MDDLLDAALAPHLASLSAPDAARRLEVLAARARWRDVPAGDPRDRARGAVALRTPVGVAPAALLALGAEVALRGGDGEALAREASERAVAHRTLALGSDDDLVHALLHETDGACALLESLRDEGDPLAARVRRLFPELGALAAVDPADVPPDYDGGGTRTALLDHLSLRALGRKLAGLERAELRRFAPGDASLSPAAFERLRDRTARVRDAGLLPLVRAALIFRDVAKGRGAVRDASRLAHNESAASLLLARSREPSSGIGLIARSLARAPFGVAEIALFVAAHGLVGQHLRGECPRAALARFVVGARRMARLLEIAHPAAASLLCDALGVLDACDTSSVREGLFSDALGARFEALEDSLAALVADRTPALDHVSAMADALATHEAHARRADTVHAATIPDGPTGDARAALLDRLARLRAGRIAKNPAARDELAAAVAQLAPREAEALAGALASCQLWYAEAATGDLAPDATMKLLALALAAASAAGVRSKPDAAGHPRLFHVDLLPLARYTAQLGAARTYALRLLETVLAPVTVADALGLDGGATPLARRLLGEEVDGERAGLGSLAVAARGERAIALAWRPSREAEALFTLLGVYERKSSAAFHATLKSLCDLYGLRKDDFDRIAAEAAYLAAMNSARDDKARLCDYALPGTILEVGPGGGVVLDLLAERFAGSRVVGLDVSRAVVEALGAKKAREARPWEVLEGDAFELARVVGARTLSTVVFCSILHEIHSYVEWNDGDGRGPGRFRLGSVRAIVAAAFRALAPGGRIIVRDGVVPPPAERVLAFRTPEAEQTFAIYAREYEGSAIAFEPAGEHRVKLSSADAHAFLYTFVWGAASFPYEIRERYGVATYERYGELLLDACDGADEGYRAASVPLAPGMRSYLQGGYVEHLAPHVALYDADGATPVPLPDSNALWVIEKVGV